MDNYKQFVLALAMAGFSFSSFAQDSKGWHLKDKQKDGYSGISLNKAYDFVKGKKSTTVIVAVIDSGIDTLHEDLKPVLWVNKKEIPGNGKDDDRNGYIDDVHGWNFIGGRDGRNVKEDSYEAARVYHRYKSRFEKISSPSALSKDDQELYVIWKRAEKQVAPDPNEVRELLYVRGILKNVVPADSILSKEMNKKNYNLADLENINVSSEVVQKAKKAMVGLFKVFQAEGETTNVFAIEQLKDHINGLEKKLGASEKLPKDYRTDIVKDNEADINDRYYGNPDIMANTPFHGTHVSGIIGAARKNGKGIDGIADNVKIMTIRAVPDGDEHDKDIALAIRYAADNGAKIINMSFGKGFSPEKHWVDDAVKYAESKGVLLIHAAGNSGANIDTTDNFPNAILKTDNKKASNWITVGASSDPKNGGDLVADFSNFGKDQVDVFAPGHQIYSTIPGGTTYGNASGTSMASPVVTGVAAFILSRYPQLTPQQLKQVIEKSVVAPAGNVTNPATGEKEPLLNLSRTGGVINAYEAAKIAEGMTKNTTVVETPTKQKPLKPVKPAKPVKPV